MRGQAGLAVGEPRGHPGRRRRSRPRRPPSASAPSWGDVPSHSWSRASWPAPRWRSRASCRRGPLEVLAVFDKPDPLDGPFFEETIYVTPSRQPPSVQAALAATAAGAAAALGLREGPVHAELRVSAAGVVTILELAARSIGGLCARALRFGAGVSLEEVIVRHAVGAGLDGLAGNPGLGGDDAPHPGRRGAREGVRSGAGPGHRRRGRPRDQHPAGRAVVPLPEGDRYLGFIFARGPTPAIVEDALRRAEASLDVRLSLRDSAQVDDLPGRLRPCGSWWSRPTSWATNRCSGHPRRGPAGRRPPGALCRPGRGHALGRRRRLGRTGRPVGADAHGHAPGLAGRRHGAGPAARAAPVLLRPVRRVAGG